MGGLFISVISIISGIWFIREKLNGRIPKGDMFTFWFGFAFAGPAAYFATLLLILQIFPENYFRHNMMLGILLIIPPIWIYLKVVEFFTSNGEKNNNFIQQPPTIKQSVQLTLKTSPQLFTIPNPKQRIDKFIVQNGIYTDIETGLMWLRFAYGQEWKNNTAVGDAKTVNWETAFDITKEFNQKGGYDAFLDWRLPTINELKTLVDKTKDKHGNCFNTNFPPDNCNWFWSSSSATNYSNSAKIIYFKTGYVTSAGKESNGAVCFVRNL